MRLKVAHVVAVPLGPTSTVGRVDAGKTVMTKVMEAVWPFWSVAVTEIGNVPACPAVKVINPGT